jgi:GTP-binding protein
MKVSARFMLSALSPEQFPPEGDVPEIAFCGRSNVGKSSLINSLLGAKHAYVSGTPGRTQAINFFHVNFGPLKDAAELRIADLPGYGYAKAPKAIVGEWPKFIEPYLALRGNLACCLCLVDSNVPPQVSDTQLMDWLKSHGRLFVVVATKTDRLSGNKLTTALRALEQAHGAKPIPFSAKTGKGSAELWRAIREAIA